MRHSRSHVTGYAIANGTCPIAASIEVYNMTFVDIMEYKIRSLINKWGTLECGSRSWQGVGK